MRSYTSDRDLRSAREEVETIRDDRGTPGTHRSLLLTTAKATAAATAAMAIVTTAGAAPAQAVAPRLSATSPDQEQGSGVTLQTEAEQLTAADRNLVVAVRLAGLWEIPAGRMAQEKGVNPRVREIGKMIREQHVRLDELDRVAAKQLNITVPDKPTDEQQRWLDEMKQATGARFDAIFVMRLRAAHGKIFPVIGQVRASTQNETVRTLAQQTNGFVMNHLTYLESTGLVLYAELPPAAAPSTKKTSAQPESGNGLAIPMIWVILGVALIAGAVASGRVIRTGGSRQDDPRAPRGAPYNQHAVLVGADPSRPSPRRAPPPRGRGPANPDRAPAGPGREPAPQSRRSGAAASRSLT